MTTALHASGDSPCHIRWRLCLEPPRQLPLTPPPHLATERTNHPPRLIDRLFEGIDVVAEGCGTAIFEIIGCVVNFHLEGRHSTV